MKEMVQKPPPNLQAVEVQPTTPVYMTLVK